MKICVYGAGAVGAHLAAKLARAGNDVSVVVREKARATIAAKGLTLITDKERFSAEVRAATDAAELGHQDLVVFTLKATAIPSLTGFEPLFGKHTAAIFVLNGIPFWYATGNSRFQKLSPIVVRLDPGGRILRAIGAERILGSVV
jgi:2-dehydropantoate 2-reductase